MTARTKGIAADGNDVFIGNWWVLYSYRLYGDRKAPSLRLPEEVNLLDFGMNVQAAGEAPRIEHLYSATPTGRPADGSGQAVAEVGLAEPIVRELIRRGHRVTRTPRNGGGYQGILIDPKTNMLHGASEARKDGAAVGY